MKTVTSKDGTTIAFDQYGAGRAVILVDGALCYRAHWGQGSLAEKLAPHFTVYTYDRRGRGESSDTQPYAVDREIEDLDALIEQAGGSVNLYGLSSGAVLALKAAAKLGSTKILNLALNEPPFNSDDPQARQEFEHYSQQVANLLESGKGGDAVALFMGDMMSPDMLENLRQSPEWPLLEAIAPTLAYDNQVMGDGAVPVTAAKAATIPTLVLVGSSSPDFKHEAVDALSQAVPHAQRKTLELQTQDFAPETAASALIDFFTANSSK
jgi:pimeloyl-ACP methyl ester carboxylesterase